MRRPPGPNSARPLGRVGTRTRADRWTPFCLRRGERAQVAQLAKETDTLPNGPNLACTWSLGAMGGGTVVVPVVIT